MKTYDTPSIRNVGIIAHGGAGKTTLAESLLFVSGTINRIGTILEGNTFMDWDPEEIKRQISLQSSIAAIEWNNHKINLVDTPGYQNFLGDTQLAMRIIDAAIIVVSGISGVKAQTERIWTWAEELHLPRIAFVNKMDQERADFDRAVHEIEQKFGKKPVKIAIPLPGPDFNGYIDLLKQQAYISDGHGKSNPGPIPDDMKDEFAAAHLELVEAVAESDDKLLEKYLAEGEISEPEVMAGLRNAVLNGKLIPVLCGCATRGIGSESLLEALITLFPSPADIKPKSALMEDKSQTSIQADPAGPFAAQVFKTIADPFAGKLSIFRVYRGELTPDSNIYNANSQHKEHIGPLLALHGKKQTPVPKAVPGDIAAVAKLRNTTTGDTLCVQSGQVRFEFKPPPEPVISFAISPRSKGDEEKISMALHRLCEEDPALRSGFDQQTRELLISGMGDVHIEVTVSKLKTKFGLEVDIKTPKVPYKETIRGSTKTQGKYKKQSGGRGQYGDCWLEIEPLPRGKGFEFVDKIVGGAIPKQYIPAVEKGVIEAMAGGIIAGYPMTDVKVTLYDGSYHDVDSSEMAFKIAGSLAFKKAAIESRPVILEPVMTVDIVVPEENIGDIIGDLNSRRGRVTGVVPAANNNQEIKAQVSMAEMLSYASQLRAITGGRGMFHMEFAHYDETPPNIADKVITEAKHLREAQHS